MFSTSLSFESSSPANALGASLGRGLVNLTNGGRSGNDSVKHVVSSQGFGSTVNVEDLIALLKTLLEETSPKGLGYGGKESDMVTSRVWDLSRSRISTMKKNPAPRSAWQWWS